VNSDILFTKQLPHYLPCCCTYCVCYQEEYCHRYVLDFFINDSLENKHGRSSPTFCDRVLQEDAKNAESKVLVLHVGHGAKGNVNCSLDDADPRNGHFVAVIIIIDDDTGCNVCKHSTYQVAWSHK